MFYQNGWKCKIKTYANRGSNPGPSACKADVITNYTIRAMLVKMGAMFDNRMCNIKINTTSGVRTHAFVRITELKSAALDHSAIVALL